MRLFIGSFFFLCVLAGPVCASPLILEGAPFADLASWVSDTTKKTILVPDAMAFKVWLRSPDASSSSALTLLRNTASVNGWTMVEKGGIVSFVLYVEPVKEVYNNLTPAAPVLPFIPEPIPLHSALFPFLNRSAADLLFAVASMSTDSQAVLGPNNSIIVTGTADVLHRLRRDVPALDSVLSRYRVEAIISEEIAGDSENLGLQLKTTNNAGSLLVDTGSAISGASILAELVRFGDFSGLFAYLNTSSKYKILSTPYIISDDGSRGVLHVGDNVPIQTGSTVANGQVTTSFSRQDVGVILSVLVRQVGDKISLDIIQEASSLSPSLIAGQVVTSQRKITTRTTVSAGEVLDLGGLSLESSKVVKTGIPFLKDIPFIGVIFSGKETVLENKILRVYLRVVPV